MTVLRRDKLLVGNQEVLTFTLRTTYRNRAPEEGTITADLRRPGDAWVIYRLIVHVDV